MAIPTYDKCMLPLLRFASDGQEHHVREAIEALANEFDLSEDDRNERLPSGRKYTFDDRVQWANTYLKKAGLLTSVRRGVFQITQAGLDVLADNPKHLSRDFLSRFPGFTEFVSIQPAKSKRETALPDEDISEKTQTPREILERSYKAIRQALAVQLLEQIRTCEDSFFEHLVVDLLVAMGYGSSIEEAGKVVGKSGDGGIDGIISEDRLGFDAVYIQAKRWGENNTVGRPVVQGFAGSLLGHGVTKGVLVTTSRFSDEAIQYINNTKQPKIVLIDGKRLAELMIEHNIGVSPTQSYTIKEIDQDYFHRE
jgi:restriction system protein